MDVLPKDLVPFVILGKDLFDDLPELHQFLYIDLGISQLLVLGHLQFEKVFQVLETQSLGL